MLNNSNHCYISFAAQEALAQGVGEEGGGGDRSGNSLPRSGQFTGTVMSGHSCDSSLILFKSVLKEGFIMSNNAPENLIEKKYF